MEQAVDNRNVSPDALLFMFLGKSIKKKKLTQNIDCLLQIGCSDFKDNAPVRRKMGSIWPNLQPFQNPKFSLKSSRNLKV